MRISKKEIIFDCSPVSSTDNIIQIVTHETQGKVRVDVTEGVTNIL